MVVVQHKNNNSIIFNTKKYYTSVMYLNKLTELQ